MTEDNLSIDEENKKYWRDLIPEEINNIYYTYREHGKYFASITRSLLEILFNWLFILNSCGLIAVVALFVMGNNVHLLPLCLYMGICFSFGIVFMYIAARFEFYKFKIKNDQLDDKFDLLQSNKISVEEYSKLVYSIISPKYWLVSFYKMSSFIFFILGLANGMGYTLLKIYGYF